MKNSQFYILSATVVIAPHASTWMAIAQCVFLMAASIVCVKLEGKP